MPHPLPAFLRAEHRSGPSRYVLIRPARSADLVTTAALHVDHLPSGLFPRLGRGFVQRWHRAHLRRPGGLAMAPS